MGIGLKHWLKDDFIQIVLHAGFPERPRLWFPPPGSGVSLEGAGRRVCASPANDGRKVKTDPVRGSSLMGK